MNRRWTLDEAINDFVNTMTVPTEIIDQLNTDSLAKQHTAPEVGDKAPEFDVERITPSGERTSESIKLFDLRGKPVALMFGNLTCPVYRGQIDRYNEIYDELKGRYQFVNIYIREAHPEDGWRLDINNEQGVIYNQPTTLDERAAVAKICVTKHNLKIPTALDNIDNDADLVYTAAPERLYILDSNGVVTYRSGRGPYDMDAVEEWYQALNRQPITAAAE